MRISDLENRSVVGTVIVLQAIATELLAAHLKALPESDRPAAIARIVADATANGKQLVEMAPKDKPAVRANAEFIQSAALRQMDAAVKEALAAVDAKPS